MWEFLSYPFKEFQKQRIDRVKIFFVFCTDEPEFFRVAKNKYYPISVSQLQNYTGIN